MIQIKKVSLSYVKGKKVIDNMSLKVENGTVFGFIGPNGAGKTTTIKIILGLQRMNDGQVIINGYDIKKDFCRAIERVGAIVESPDMYMYLSGKKNLQIIARMYKGVSKERIDEVIKLVGLEERINDKVSKYSLGMRQRLGIAASLIHSPNLLVLDEPTNGLDPEGIKDLRNLLKKLAKKDKIGILISSHNLSELESFCTDVCIIKNGEIIEYTSVKKAKKADQTSYIISLSKISGIDKYLNENDEVLEDNKIRVFIDKEEIMKFARKLDDNGYKVYEFVLETLTLEDAFLNKAGGNKID